MIGETLSADVLITSTDAGYDLAGYKKKDAIKKMQKLKLHKNIQIQTCALILILLVEDNTHITEDNTHITEDNTHITNIFFKLCQTPTSLSLVILSRDLNKEFLVHKLIHTTHLPG